MTGYIGRRGLVLSFDSRRSLGDFEIDGGERIRFGGPEIARLDPAPGTEFVIKEVGQTYSGELKVTRLARVGEPVGAAIWGGSGRGSFNLESFAAGNPTWVGEGAAEPLVRSALSGSTLLRMTLRPHPFFDFWRDAIARTAALRLGLTYRVGQIAPGESRVGGTVAELAGSWPTCSVCAAPLTLIGQLYLREFPALFDEGGSLLLMLCLEHLPEDHTRLESGRGWLKYTPADTVAATVHRTLGDRILANRSPGRRVEAIPQVSFPSPAALRETLHSPTAQELFSVWLAESEQTGADAYQEWVAPGPPASQLGGYARWTGPDRTPTCSTYSASMALVAEFVADRELPLAQPAAVFACRRTPGCGGLSQARYQLA